MLKENFQQLNLQVTAEVAVSVLPNLEHEFLMTTKEVAHGYGTSIYAINMARIRHEAELIEGKHYIKLSAITKCYSELNLAHNAILYTKRGIVRLGFFIKSERAKLFRDWAEELIISVDKLSSENFLRPVPVLAEPKKRRHNRLSQERLVSILADVAKIDDRALRLSLIEKLGV